MRITAQEEYGLRILVLMARRGEPLTLAEISEAEALSVPYCSKLLARLKQDGLVEAERGRKGGHRLAKPPAGIRLQEIFRALGDALFDGTHCARYATGEGEECIHVEDCRVRDVWASLGEVVDDLLGQITLEDLAMLNSQREGGLASLRALHRARGQVSVREGDEGDSLD